ncbi:MAG: hypothetical protein VKN72_09250 [Nostocales cyanobacterium 94392]|nr:hypothetical protein [Nostocales cyanobacterium 94392]
MCLPWLCQLFLPKLDAPPFLTNGDLLRVANDEERKAFYKLKKQENEVINFNYPEINYTLSIGDTLEPILV